MTGTLTYAYYPGCTQETTAKEYDESVRAVCSALGIELKDIPEWTCCGASSGHAIDYMISHALAGRNLAIAEKMNMDVAVACPACYLRLNATRHEYRTKPEFRQKLTALLSQPYSAGYNIRHVLDIVSNDIKLKTIAEKISRPLTGLRVVTYYGCYLVRPPGLTNFDDPENPQTMDTLLKACGADVSDWAGKVDCCGGSHSFTLRDNVVKLVHSIIESAKEVEAEAIVTACPLCHINLETRQKGENPLPVFYFTELLGLAMGLNARPWLKRHLLIPQKLLEKHSLLYY